MKPFQIIIIAIFAVGAAAGLYFFATFGGFTGGTKPAGTVVIWGTLPHAAMDTAIADLKTAHKEYSNVSYVQKPAATFDASVADALAAGKGPDMIVIDQEQLLAERDKLRVIPFSSVSQRTFLNTYIPEGQLFLSSDGSYALPLVVDPLVMYYNRSTLSSHGVASPPTSWEAVLGLTPSLTTASGQTITKSTVAFGQYDNIGNARAIISMLLLQAGNTITTNTTQGIRSVLGQAPQGQSFGATSPAQSALTFYTQFANPAKTSYSWNRSLPPDRQAFVTGDLAFYFGFASEVQFLSGANPNLDFDMAPVPSPATVTARATYGLTYAFAIPTQSKNAAGAFRTAIALSADDVLSKLAAGLSMAPAKRSLLTPSSSDPYQAVYYPEALQATGWLSPAPATTDALFATMIGNITTGRMDVGAALASADQTLSAALAN